MAETYFKHVGNNIRRVLEGKNMSQQALATKLNISKQIVHKILSGNKSINVSEISSIARILDTTVDRLLPAQDTKELLVPSFSFMGEIQDPAVKKGVEHLKTVIDQIFLLDGLLHNGHI